MPAYHVWRSRFPSAPKEVRVIDAPDLSTALCVAAGHYGRANITHLQREWQDGGKLFWVEAARRPRVPAATSNGRLL